MTDPTLEQEPATPDEIDRADDRAHAGGVSPVKRPPRAIGTVVFDCDSTLVAIEGITALAREHHDEIERLTEAAMNGEVALEDVYARRLDLVRPSRTRVEELATEYIAALVPDARELVAALRSEGWAIRIASAGLRPAVEGVAHELGIPAEHVAAVDIYFDENGHYAGFDSGSMLTRSGGKSDLLALWRDRLPRPLVLVGDGVTDLEAVDDVDSFIAYTGVVERQEVVDGADVALPWRSLAPALPFILIGRPPEDPAALALFMKGLELMDATEARQASSQNGYSNTEN